MLSLPSYLNFLLFYAYLLLLNRRRLLVRLLDHEWQLVFVLRGFAQFGILSTRAVDIVAFPLALLRQLLNVLVHVDVQTLEEQVHHDQTHRVVLPHFQQVACLRLKIFLVLLFYII